MQRSVGNLGGSARQMTAACTPGRAAAHRVQTYPTLTLLKRAMHGARRSLDLKDIKVVTKLGGTVDDSEAVPGMVFDQKASTSAGGPTRIEGAKIALLQFCISPPKTDLENNVIISDYAQMDRCGRARARPPARSAARMRRPQGALQFIALQATCLSSPGDCIHAQQCAAWAPKSAQTAATFPYVQWSNMPPVSVRARRSLRKRAAAMCPASNCTSVLILTHNGVDR